MDFDPERIGEPFKRHERASLHFSGGKDSLACLLLLRPWWDRIVVTWCNTGDTFPETVELVRRVQAEVPHFREVRSHVKPWIEFTGWPVEALPVGHSAEERAFFGRDKPLMQLYVNCCNQNIWTPLYMADRELGVTLTVTGKRLADSSSRPSMLPGAVHLGNEAHMPIWDWSDADVWAFLEAEGIELPPHYRLAPDTTSLDCMHCTAWWRSGSRGQLRVLAERYPETHREVMRRLRAIRAGIEDEVKHLDRVLNEEPETPGETVTAASAA